AGEAVYLRGNFDSATAFWRAGLREARQSGDSALQARLLTWLGLAAYRQGKYPEAHRNGEAALALKLKLGLRTEVSKSYNALGLLAWNEGKLPQAIQLFQAASKTARDAADQSALAKAANNLALVHTELGQFAEARTGFRAALESGHKLSDRRIEGGALTNLAMLDIQTGNPVDAIASLEEARGLYRSIGYETGEQNSLGQLGTAYQALGEPRLALAALDTALQVARREGLRQEEASDLELIAEIYRDAGDPQRALELYRQAQPLNAELGLEVDRGTDLRNQAEIQASLGRAILARQLAIQARAIHRSARARLQELRDNLLLADLAARSGAHAEVGSVLRRADHLAAELDARTARLETALTTARIADGEKDSRAVLRVLKSARVDLAQGGYGTEWQAAMLKARAYARLGALQLALSSGREAVAAVERVRANFGSGFLRTSYVADKSAPYSDLVETLLRMGRTEEAFEVADALRARALVEHLATTEEDHGPTSTTLQSLAQGETLLRQIELLVSREDALEETPPAERSAGAADQIRFLAEEINRTRSAYEALAVDLAERDAVGSALLGARRASAVQVRMALHPGEALLEYLVTPARVVLFVVTRDAVHQFATPIAIAKLESRVRVARELVARSPQGAPPELSALDSLYDILVRPAVGSGVLQGIDRLTLVTHSFLSYLPFAALRNSATHHYVVEDYALNQLPSAAVLPVLRGGGSDSRGTSHGSIMAAIFAPFPKALPASAREASSVRRATGQAELYLGGRATEKWVRSALATPSIVHVATHGTMNPRNPMFSRIALAPGGAGLSEDDGWLEVHEVLGLHIRSPLVFLSGCQTGAGAAWAGGFGRGEDYATLAQAFLYAGAKSVVATLWRIEDEGAAVFADRFYRLLEQMGGPDALASAQREMLHDPAYQAPYFWAAYQIAGNDDRGPQSHISALDSVSLR
ncbi:MAG: hypothetical protein QOK27_982, partial [Gemmatimonadales bacterium]|nr:hypothetical protein [Gemmatimonadales bacterium]